MDPQTNPFAALTLIAAPAVLTNACSVLALGTGNRLARAVDRARELATQLEQPGALDGEMAPFRCDELTSVQKRMLMLIRALQAFYVGIGSFATAALLSLLGAVMMSRTPDIVANAMEVLAVGVGGIAVAALIRGSWFLVSETRIAVDSLEKRANRVQSQFAARHPQR
jgi:hypothetical protein